MTCNILMSLPYPKNSDAGKYSNLVEHMGVGPPEGSVTGHGRYHPSTACPRSTNRTLDEMVMLRWCWVFPTTATQQLRGSSNLSWGDLHQNGLSHWLTPHIFFARNSNIAMIKRKNHLQSPQDHRFSCWLDQIPDVAAIPEVGRKKWQLSPHFGG